MRTKRRCIIICPDCGAEINIHQLVEEKGTLGYPSQTVSVKPTPAPVPVSAPVREVPKRHIPKRRVKPKRAANFVPPTPEEAEEYAKSIYFNLDGNAFCDHYEARGWRYGAGCKMRSWKAAVRTWKNRRKEFGRNGKGSPREPDALPIDKQHELYYGKHDRRPKR